MKRKAVTIRDVAAAAGVTPMTVSNVINGRTDQMSRETFARVLEVCRALDYRPHASARRLRTDRRMAVGVVIVDPTPHYLADPFIAAVLAGLNVSLSAGGYSIVLHGALPEKLAMLPMMQRIETDALCVFLAGTRDERRGLLADLAALGQPLVLLQENLPDIEGGGLDLPDACAVAQDDFGGGVTVARHVLESGARQITMLVPDAVWSAMERREAGVRAVLAQLADPPRLDLVHCGDESYLDTQRAFSAYIARKGVPDVVIGGNDQMAIAAMNLLTARGHRVPEEVRVTGFNGFDIWRYATPTLTTVFSPAFLIGQRAGEAIVTRLAAGRFAERQVILPVTFGPNRSSARC